MVYNIPMAIIVHFFGDLPSLLPLKKRAKMVSVPWIGKRSVRDLVQSLQIPHTEIGKIKVNGKLKDDSFILTENDTVEVYPGDTSYSHSHRDVPPIFLCDVHLWKLARRLRLLGFDSAFEPQWDDATLAMISQREKRILLTRDRGLLKRSAVERGLLVRNTDPEEQVKEILQRLNISPFIKPFTRCLMCNGHLEPADITSTFFRENLKSGIPAQILERFQKFHYCIQCEKVFWEGSHHKRLSLLIQKYMER